jgi:hypothetical protein
MSEMNTDQRSEIEERLADLETKYWVIEDGELYVKQGKGSVCAMRFYAHADPAGTLHWNRDHRNVTDKEFKTLAGWQSSKETPIPNASE